MKYLLILLTLSFGLVTQSLHADEKTTAQVQNGFLQSVMSGLLIKGSVKALDDLLQLEQTLEKLKASKDSQSLDQAQLEFKTFINSWKAVETVYIAGALDEDFLDHPRFIDYFHQANESIPELVQRALNSDSSLQTALFKNSTKSINALEYLLFSKAEHSSLFDDMLARDNRRLNASLIVVRNIQNWLEEIVGLYKSDKKFMIDAQNSTGLIVNALIDSSYKLANWRVGEAGGLVKKYQGKVSAQRLEYPLSASSLAAIKIILETHRKIIDDDGEQDLLAVARIKNVETELMFIRKKIDEALSVIDKMPEPLSMQLETEPYQQLHLRLSQLHDAYYFMLIDALGLSANIIDADGD